MSKQIVTLEYELNTRSSSIIWHLISTIDGLSSWLADNVEQNGDTITFTWGEVWTHHEIRSANIISFEKNKHIRFKWNDDEDEEDYWEMKIGQSKETDDYMLLITDFADNDDVEGIMDIWNNNMDRLRRASGI